MIPQSRLPERGRGDSERSGRHDGYEPRSYARLNAYRQHAAHVSPQLRTIPLADNRDTRYSGDMSDLVRPTMKTDLAIMISIMETITKRSPAGPEERD